MTYGTTGAPGISPNIRIYKQRNNIDRGSDEVFSVTIHETAHWSHFSRAGIKFNLCGRFLRESWAMGVEWYLTQMEYKEKGIWNYGEWDYNPTKKPGEPELALPMRQGYQYWVLNTPHSDKDRSPLFIDLYDTFNQLNYVF